MNRSRWGALFALAFTLLIAFAGSLMAAEGARPVVSFNHNQTQFQLTGMHTNTACESCHVKGVFKGTPTSCTECHNRVGAVNAQTKPATHIPVTKDCSTCHLPQGWLPTIFTHDMVQSQSCATCHNGTNQTGKPAGHVQTSKDCFACHKTKAWVPAGFDHAGVVKGSCATCHNGTTATGKSPNHIRTTRSCDDCHKTAAWLPAGFNHLGVAPGSCTTCHDGNTANGKPTGHIPTLAQCDSCHTTTAWLPASKFDHAANGVTAATNCAQSGCHGTPGGSAPKAGKPVSGAMAHALPPMANGPCADCHTIGGTWASAMMNHNGATNCTGCHVTTGNGFTQAKANHIPTSGAQCVLCHATTGWLPTQFDHSKVSAANNCSNCHNGTGATGKSNTHIPVSQQCDVCHATAAWKPSVFTHTSLQVAGKTCSQCHNGTSASGRPTTGTKAHNTAPMTGNCESCHTTTAWTSATMSHAGATSCSSCHVIGSNGNDWTPGKISHISIAGFAQCSDCHTTSQWKPSTFSHQGISTATNCTVSCHNGTNATGRPVSGAKAHTVAPMTSTSCGSCHTIGTSWFPATMNHTGITTCTTCHTYSGNSWTPAKASHISTTASCLSCHTTKAWLPANFSHTVAGVTAASSCTQSGCHDIPNATAPRAGQPTSGSKSHTVAPMNSTTCASCHAIGGSWAPATMNHAGATNCEGCHSKTGNAWTITPSPAHLATASPCSNCHTTKAWKPATFKHDGLTSATDCTTCHNGTNATGRPSTGPKAHTVAPMTGNACGSCHSIGTVWTPATLNHSGLTSCASCHAISPAGNGFTPGKANHISTVGHAQCSDCHATTAWKPTSFAHNGMTPADNCTTCHNGTAATGRPTSGAKAHTMSPMTSNTCGSCHSIGTGWTPTTMNHAGATTCTNCHVISAAGNAWTLGKSNHISTTGYAQCDSCHTVNAWKPTSFNHNGVTNATNCTNCHNGTAATGLPTSGAKAHIVAPMTNNTCGSCHAIGTAWTAAVMNHAGITSCTSCHAYTGNNFTPVKTNHVGTTSECSVCHTTAVGGWKTAKVTHNGVTSATNCFNGCHDGTHANGRPTSGTKAHLAAPMTNVTCGSCHAIGTTWASATMNHTGASNCSTCHAYTSSNSWTVPSPVATHVTTGAQCSSCHTTTVWKPATFNHSANGVTTATDCTQAGCHNSINASTPKAGRPTSGAKAHTTAPMTSNTCANCHAIGTSWTAATMSHTGAVSCSSCHAYNASNAWTAGAPAANHPPIGSQQCSACHSTSVWTGARVNHASYTAATNCAQSGCHDVVNKATPQAGRPTSGAKAHSVAPLTSASGTCASCHLIGTAWTPATMDHTGLSGCSSCHVTGGNGFTPTKANHIPYSTSIYPQCSSCHLTSAWMPTTFAHGGLNKASDCTTCHNGSAASGTPAGAKAHAVAPMTAKTCGSCHNIGGGWLPAKMDHNGATSCSSCHTTGGNNWTPPKTSHISTSGYAQCDSCHLTTAWLPTSFTHNGVTAATTCTSCHNGTSATGRPTSGPKAHTVAPLTSNTCGSCHTIGTAWAPATMDHNGLTACATCHTYTGNGFTPARASHVSTSAQCSSCHQTSTWSGAIFNHAANNVTTATNCTQAGCHDIANATKPAGRPTTGSKAHLYAPMTSATCASCHTIGGNWLGARMDHTGATGCSSCHAYNTQSAWTTGAPAANHPSTTSQCSVCHSTSVWTGARVNHASYTAATNCTQAGCHDVANAAVPKAGRPTSGSKAHIVSPMTSTTCASCHLIGTAWTPATMNHSGLTSCTSCHATGGNGFTPAKANHISTAGYAQCSSCHTTSAWLPTSFKHTGITEASNCTTCHNGTAATGKPVSHATAPMTNPTCGNCHIIGYAWKPVAMNHAGATLCASCHTTPVGNAWTPAKTNHISTAGYAQCSSCHTTTVWAPSNFSHSGITSATNCSTCHNGTSATGTPTGAKAHTVAPMTSTTCGSCHTIGTTWAPATMNHTGLTACSTCHSFAGNGFTPAKSGHISTAGYGECSSCHATTGWLPTSFKHNGMTAATDCTTCHNGTNASGRPTSGAKAHINAPMTNVTCGSCHIIGYGWTPAVMNHAGVTTCTNCHSYGGNGFTPAKANHIVTASVCSDCHTTTAWTPTSFAHTTTQIAGKTCKDCHNGTSATGPSASHAGVSPAPYNCNSCHRTTAWSPATFTHSGVTANCTSCHKTGFAPTKSTSHFVTSQPCERCHTTTAWAPIRAYSHTSPYYKQHSGPSMTNKADCLLCHIGNNEVIAGAPHMGSAAYKPDCAWCHAQQYKAGEHKKTTSPTTVLYRVDELKDCSGACHEYTNNTFTVIKRTRTGQHHSSDSEF